MTIVALPGREGVILPPFLYGTAWKEERTQELTGQAIDAGFRGIDTANQRRHYVEAAAGGAIAAAIRACKVRRQDLFVQTKFTYQAGQDHRLPYDPDADLATQVRQSVASSLEHLGTEWIDSYVLHGPSSGRGWAREDSIVWQAMRQIQSEGRVKLLGVSNVSIRHLEGLLAEDPPGPTFVQNRCYASRGWDREVRTLCKARGIIYQGFSLLTANGQVLEDPGVIEMAVRRSVEPAQIVFRFAQQIGMLPLTGTSSLARMKADLACDRFDLDAREMHAIETVGD